MERSPYLALWRDNLVVFDDYNWLWKRQGD